MGIYFDLFLVNICQSLLITIFCPKSSSPLSNRRFYTSRIYFLKHLNIVRLSSFLQFLLVSDKHILKTLALGEAIEIFWRHGLSLSYSLFLYPRLGVRVEREKPQIQKDM